MKFELDDNSRGALYYLIAGATVVLAFLGIGWALEHYFAVTGMWRSFGHGYLIADDGTHLVSADTGLGERVATALVLAFVCAIVVGAATASVAWMLKVSTRRPALVAARTVFAIALGYCGYAALHLPPAEFIGYRDRMIILWQRSELLNDIPWPGTRTIHLIPWANIADVRATPVGKEDGPGHVRIECILHDGSLIPLGNSSPLDGDPPAAMHFASERAARILRMVRSM